MGVKWKVKKNLFPGMETAARQLNGKKVSIGVFGEYAWLAGIHEYGCTIKPGRAKYLTVPCNSAAKGKRASDFPDLFFMESRRGKKLLARKTGSGGIEIMFILMDEVNIPERAFMRQGHDDNIDRVIGNVDALMTKVIHGELAESTLLQTVGLLMSSAIKDSARDLSSPANSPVTASTKGSSNPLIDTGGMIGSISYEVG